MTNMTNKQLFRTGLGVLAGIALCTVSLSLLTAQESKLRIIQTNSAGDNIHIIDPVANKVVGEIKGIEASHGIAVARDGSRIYISEEAQRTLDVVDGKTLSVIKRIPLSGVPILLHSVLMSDGSMLRFYLHGTTYHIFRRLGPKPAAASTDRKSGVEGKSGDLGGSPIL